MATEIEQAILHQAVNPALWHNEGVKEPEVIERFPNPNRVISHLVYATSHTASDVDNFLAHNPIPSAQDFDRVKIDMDNVAGKSLREGLDEAPHEIHSVGSEGGKDEEKTGFKVDTVIGVHGKRGDEKIDLVNDPIEGTDNALLRLPNAIVIAAAGPRRGLLRKTPKGIKYMRKIAGPPELQGIIHLDQGHTENLAAAARELGIRPEDIDVIGLDGPTRERNYALRDEVRDFGSIWKPLDRGDLLPALKAVTKGYDGRRLTLMMGIGGYEEGIIGLAGAAAAGGVGMGEAWHSDLELREKNAGLIDASRPGINRDQYIVVYSAITPDEWLGVPGVSHHEGEKRVFSLALSSKPEQKFVHSIPIPTVSKS